jgi:hypothetical protein
MKAIFLLGTVLVLCVAGAAGQGKPDPLTGLPVIPTRATVIAGKSYGIQPTKMPDGPVCKSKMQGNFYFLLSSKIKLSSAVAWYGSHLSGFKKVQGYESMRSQTAFFNSDRTILVIVTGDHGAQGQDADAYSVAYEKYQPGLSEKTVDGVARGKIVCK